MNKKIVIFVFGVADGFCSETSPRFLSNGKEIVAKTKDILAETGKRFGGIVYVNSPADTFEKVNIAELVAPTKVIDIKLCAEKLIHANNEMAITDIHGGKMLFNGDQLDFVLRPEEFEVHILGVDINGIFIDTIDSLIQLGYDVTVYSDIIKPFSKKTIQHIKNSNCKFISGKNVCLT